MSDPSKNRIRGKNYERKIAKILKGKRIGILGKEDIEHPVFSMEVKTRNKYAGDNFMTQAINNCPGGKIPIVITHINGRRHENDLVEIKLKHFIEILEGGELWTRLNSNII